MLSPTTAQHARDVLRAAHVGGLWDDPETADQVALGLLGEGPIPKTGLPAPELVRTREFVRRIKGLPSSNLDPATPLPTDRATPTAAADPTAADAPSHPFGAVVEEHLDAGTERLRQALLDLFVQEARDRLPDCFLRSLPKFGKGAAHLAPLFGRSLNRRHTDTLADRRAAPFELTVQSDVREAVAVDITAVVNEELGKRLQAFAADVGRLTAAGSVRQSRLETLEGELVAERQRARGLEARMEQAEAAAREAQEQVAAMGRSLEASERQLALARDQLQRRTHILDEQRARFHREVMKYQSRLYELQAKADCGPTDPRRTPADYSHHDLAASMGAFEGFEVIEAVDAATRELREQTTATIQKLRTDFAREKKELLLQKRLAVDDRDREIFRLKMHAKAQERLQEVERSRTRKLHDAMLEELRMQYDHRLATLQAELDTFKRVK